MSNEKILLTQDDVEGWKAEKASLEEQISAAQAKLNKINQLLEAAATLSRSKAGPAKPEETATDAKSEIPISELEPMTEAVIEVVKRNGGSAKRGVIKAGLRNAGYPESRLGNYFYTVLARHVQRGRLAKIGSRYILKDQKPSPENHEAPSKPVGSGVLGASNETGLAVQ